MAERFQQELDVAIRAVTVASQICRSVQATIDVSAIEKNDRSPVTVADFASQAAVCHLLKLAFPDDPIVGEENSAELKAPENRSHLDRVVSELGRVDLHTDAATACQWIDHGNHNGRADRFWTLDPIDGTKGFLRKEQFAVSLALIVDGELQVAALACPNLGAQDAWDNAKGVVFYAVRGQGAQLRPIDMPQVTPHTVRTSSTGKPSAARMCESVESGHSSHDHSSQICEKLGIKASVRLDSQAKYGVVARGEADIYLRLPTRAGYEEKIWDHAGGVLVVEEAGGTVSDIDGRPLDFSQGSTLSQNRGVVVTNGLLHTQVLAAIKEIGI